MVLVCWFGTDDEDLCFVVVQLQHVGFHPLAGTDDTAFHFPDGNLGWSDAMKFKYWHLTFDTVDQQLLCTKLKLYRIRGVAYQWIRSYLSNRKQYVSYEWHKSERLPIQCGVPQGSILGPLLFTIYVNDMCNVSKLLKFILFADDTNIFHSHSKLPGLSRWTKYGAW